MRSRIGSLASLGLQITRCLHQATSWSVAIVMLTSTSLGPLASATELYKTSTFELSAADALHEQENYRAGSYEYSDFPEELEFTKRITRLRVELNLIEVTEFGTQSPYPEINSSVGMLMCSFTAMLMLSKNGYEQALEKEFWIFTRNLLELNSELSRTASIREAQQIVFFEKIFTEMQAIHQQATQRISFQERQRIQKFMTALGERVLDNSFAVELRSMQYHAVDTLGRFSTPVFVVGMVMGILGGILGVASLSWMDGLDLPVALKAPIVITQVVGLALGGFAAGIIAMREFLRPLAPYDRNMQRVKSAVSRCLLLLGAKGASNE